jgi:hypothetical protein
MSTVEDTNKIDAVGIDKKTDKVTLKIFDHLDWSDEQKHLYLLQEKLNSYLRFLESKEIYEAYPPSKGRELEINIDFATTPSKNALQFLDTASQVIQEAGFTLTFTVDSI